ncbi:MAG: hypothetical protein AB8G26_14270 [Ilumatobacter sp.]
MRVWKLLGLAGVVGVAAAGITAGRRSSLERQRREYRDGDPDDLHDRLHARFAEAQARSAPAS